MVACGGHVNWILEIGQTVVRREFHQQFGGNPMSGISPSPKRQEIYLFSSREAGVRYGYAEHEGFREDGVFQYTGAGQGDQELVRGNKSLLDAAINGWSIHLFQASSPHATYVGQFELADEPFTEKLAPDASGRVRRTIVFNLVPIDADLRQLAEREALIAEINDWTYRDDSDYEYGAWISTDENSAKRLEFTLQNRFVAWRRNLGHQVKALTVVNASTRLIPDIYDETTAEVIEAKRSAARSLVRLAVGQVLDYRNNAKKVSLELRPAILLPGQPEPDLIELCRELHIAVYVPESDKFVDLTAQ